MTHDCMKRRLLYAASQAYDPELETMGRTVGWLERPVTVQRGADCVLVGRVAEGVIVAFRGMLAPFHNGRHGGWAELLDWLGEAKAYCVADPAYPGRVHRGFAGALRQLWHDGDAGPGVRSAVQHFLDRGAPPHLFVAGHGKGGALANLFAWRAIGQPGWHEVAASVATFGAPCAGDAGFALAYDSSRIVCLRYETPGDPVPHLPLGPDSPQWAAALARALFPGVIAQRYRAVGVAMAPAPGRGGIGAELESLGGVAKAGMLDWAMLTPALVAAHAICPRSGYDVLVCTGERQRCSHGAPMPAQWRDAA